MDLTFNSLVPGRSKREEYRHTPLPTNAKLVPLLVAVPDAEDRAANREADKTAAATRTTFCFPNSGWRRLLLLLVLFFAAWLVWELVPRGEVGDRSGLTFSGSAV
ncbi:MAG: hypothetical protein ACKVG5_15815, partial [Acidimicrobiales bacterium]